ncbi:MAG: tetratricopeptide repeat protein [Candidatus Aminicenantes bacterium]|nr:tetratricopeptide repeat protein [Candidatus Aminicenantes bacterium]
MRKTTVLVLVVITFLGSVFLYAKVFATVIGSVKSKDGTPIPGAQVILIFSQDGTKFELDTDEKGQWKKVNLRPGTWTIGFLADGYEPENLTVELSAIKKNPPVDVRLNPIPQSPLVQGDAFYAEQKYDAALQEYQRVLEEHPDLPLLYDKIGLCYYRMNDYDNAIVHFKKMLEYEPQSQDTLINLSAIYFERGDLEEGMKYFQLLDGQTLTDSSLFYNIGVLFFKSNQVDSAITYLSKSIELNPDNIDAHYQLGLANLNKGDMVLAKESFAKVIAIDPDSEKAALAKNLLEHIK